MSLAARAPVDRRALVAALITVVLWASAFVGIRAASVDLAPGSLALGRLAVGAISLAVLVLARGLVRPSRRDFMLVVASGLLWFAFYNVALNAAEQNVDAGTASMLTNMGPILIAHLRRPVPRRGVPAAPQRRDRDRLPRDPDHRLRLVVGARARRQRAAGDRPVRGGRHAYAGGVTLQKPALRALPAAQVTWMACLAGAIACLPFLPSLVSRPRDRAAGEHRVDGLPRPVPDRDRVHDLGVRAQPVVGGTPRVDDLPRPARRHRHGLAGAGRGAAGARHRGRRAVHRRGHRRAVARRAPVAPRAVAAA